MKQGKQITLQWIPAHEGVTGNELADRAAKLATGWRPRVKCDVLCVDELLWSITKEEEQRTEDTDNTGKFVKYPKLKSASYRQINASLLPDWREQWKKSKTGKDLQAIDITLPSKKVLGLHSKHKPANSILIQLRTQKIGLRAFLHSRKVPGFEHDDGAICECEEGFQTV